MHLLTGQHVAIAFGMVLFAGLATMIGAVLLFIFNFFSAKALARALGVSAGVMLYVSFVEIFAVKSVNGFLDSDFSESSSWRYATLCFFLGVIFTGILDYFIQYIESHMKENKEENTYKDVKCEANWDIEMNPFEAHDVTNVEPNQHTIKLKEDKCECNDEITEADKETEIVIKKLYESDPLLFKIQKMGYLCFFIICLHNLPEGLATFVSAVEDRTSGFVIAFAIIIHNIPEGIIVSLPTYYVTRSKKQALFLSFISGITEPIGALLGWFVLMSLDDSVYGILFGFIAGMMVFVTIKELIPTALSFGSSYTDVAISVFVGMAIMALSLILFAV